MRGHGPRDWQDATSLVAAQHALAVAAPAPWVPGPGPLRAAGCFVAFRRGEAGPGGPGDRAWVGAVVVEEPDRLVEEVVVEATAGAAYAPGLLALREGPGVLAALTALRTTPDVVVLDATGRDHPRRAGLALHVGAVLDLPSVGVTHRPLVAAGEPPPATAARASMPVRLDGEVVAAWLRTREGVRPVVVHAGWRTDVAAAIEVVLRTTAAARTPEPLRLARRAARERRSRHERRGTAG